MRLRFPYATSLRAITMVSVHFDQVQIRAQIDRWSSIKGDTLSSQWLGCQSYSEMTVCKLRLTRVYLRVRLETAPIASLST